VLTRTLARTHSRSHVARRVGGLLVVNRRLEEFEAERKECLAKSSSHTDTTAGTPGQPRRS